MFFQTPGASRRRGQRCAGPVPATGISASRLAVSGLLRPADGGSKVIERRPPANELIRQRARLDRRDQGREMKAQGLGSAVIATNDAHRLRRWRFWAASRSSTASIRQPTSLLCGELRDVPLCPLRPFRFFARPAVSVASYVLSIRGGSSPAVLMRKEGRGS
jgi:hypothetical protein